MNRFSPCPPASALPFVGHLLSQKSYLDTLRAHCAKRACPAGKLPKNDQLLERLQEETQVV
ncbi:MAG: hypothetical protein PHX93_00290 [Candidatus Peribacteraceae bacterium]|jgi:hypothetical protein|nr:hypothetical protein [Candidatus Peribacteraceae bacterium]